MKIDIGDDYLDIIVDGQQILHIGQVSDDNTINLFLYPKGEIVESIMHEEDNSSKCTHERRSVYIYFIVKSFTVGNKKK